MTNVARMKRRASFKSYYKANKHKILAHRKLPGVRERYRQYRRNHWLKNKDISRKQSREWYKSNTTRACQYAVGYKAKVYAATGKLIRAAKRAPCTDCHKRYPQYIMEFDHCRGNKSGDIGRFRTSMSAFVRELSKCDVVCANCHRKRTHKRRRK